jgi:uncharacterized membrane protein YhiD involved in acid resistance
VALALTYLLGYERELAIAGAVTGIGFIGGGIVVRRAVRTGEIISGITAAASIFAIAAIGAAAGAGLLAVAAPTTGLVLVAGRGTSSAGHHSHRRWHHRCHRLPVCSRPGWT